MKQVCFLIEETNNICVLKLTTLGVNYSLCLSCNICDWNMSPSLEIKSVHIAGHWGRDCRDWCRDCHSNSPLRKGCVEYYGVTHICQVSLSLGTIFKGMRVYISLFALLSDIVCICMYCIMCSSCAEDIYVYRKQHNPVARSGIGLSPFLWTM